jgi:hypothetical protein
MKGVGKMLARVVCSMLMCAFVSAPLLAQGPPENSGPNVERWEMYGGPPYFFWFAVIDEKRNYVAVIGVDLEAICVGEPDVWGVWDVQDVYLPPGDNLLHSVYKGEQIPTLVYPIEMLDNPTWCDAANATDPIATGWTHVIVTDNDVFAWQDEFHPRTNAWHLSAHGLLESFEDGEQMMFNGGLNCQWPGYPEDPSTTGKCTQKVVLH